jgi:hypothetical protein
VLDPLSVLLILSRGTTAGLDDDKDDEEREQYAAHS